MDWTQVTGALAAVLALVGIARALKRGESRIADPATARAMAEQALVAFTARDAAVSTDGSAAVVAGDGAVAVLRRRGAKVVVRRLIPPLRVMEAVEGATVDTGDPAVGRVLLFGVLTDEVRRMESVAGRIGGVVVTPEQWRRGGDARAMASRDGRAVKKGPELSPRPSRPQEEPQ